MHLCRVSIPGFWPSTFILDVSTFTGYFACICRSKWLRLSHKVDCLQPLFGNTVECRFGPVFLLIVTRLSPLPHRTERARPSSARERIDLAEADASRQEVG